MTVFVALLRAVNVGGNSRLPMDELKSLCVSAGFEAVRTYIASGNVVLESPWPESQVKAALESALEAYAGRPISVMVRGAAELDAVLAANPFQHTPAPKTAIIFLDSAPPPDTLEQVSGVNGEDIRLGGREIYVHYPYGMGTSRLKFPAAVTGTARNLKTVAKLVAMTRPT
ncbi:MAG: DUF1697 domain-containing protein [Magnetospirillum sp.]|nr:DUF1697 domain-containing protein [Magnetospirillum sp.]